MSDARRPKGRLFYWALTLMMMAGIGLAAREGSAAGAKVESLSKAKARAAELLAAEAVPAASPIPQSGPALTSVVDTVYLADGTAAQGVLIITWPAFVTASGTAVAAGSLDATLGTNGALNIELAANAGANPAGIYYTVVYQLQPSEVRTEYWVVPGSSPATLAEVRTTPGTGIAAQPVSLQYVNTALAAKANDNAVVHLAGTEAVTGIKSFSAPPNVPTPVGSADVANKNYVDTAVAAVGAGNYLPTAGGAMTGPLTLSGSPMAPLQAADKSYVDMGIAVKADLISGLVPTNELGSGSASALNCLLGSGAWGPCGSSANATAIQSVPVATGMPANGQVLAYSSTAAQYVPSTPSGGTGSVAVAPSASQNIAQPQGTQFSANNISGIRYVTASDNWSTSPSGSLTGGTQATVTLTPCPLGIDASGFAMYYVYLSAQGTPEPAMVTGGTCVEGAASGTIVFTPLNSHPAGYKISSASSGIQEAINDACGLPTGGNAGNPNARVVLPATGSLGNAIPVYGTIYAHCSRALIEGNGALLACSTRDRCMVLGDLVNSNHYGGVTLRGVNFTSTVKQDGCQITNTQRQANLVTITTAGACSTVQNGDTVNINFTDNPAYWGNHGPVTVSGTSITYVQTAGNLAAAATPGTIAIENAAVEDNALPGTMEDIKSSSGGGGNFNQFFVMDDDEAATIRNFDADGSQALTCTANHCGSYVYNANRGAPVLWLSHLNISPQCGGNGITVYGNNTTRISDSVIQGFAMWAVNTENVLGNYGGTTMENVYMEEGAGPCPHPYEGNSFSATGIIYEGNVQPLLVRGGEQPGGHLGIFAAQNSGTVEYNYYVIANDTTTGWHSAPLFAGYALTNGTGSVAGQFPHIPPVHPGDTVTYDILRMEPPLSITANAPSFPMRGACTGGSVAACGSVVTGQAQCAGLVCTFSDASTSASTTSYTINSLSWAPMLPFWPASVVLAGDGTQTYFTPTAVFDTDPGDVVAVNWNAYPEVFVRSCGQEPNSFGGAMETCADGNPNTQNLVGTLLNDGLAGIGQPSGTKGRLNFQSIASNAHHIITLVDSNIGKTTATVGFRPPNDANDTYIGLDNGSGGGSSAAQLAFGSPVSISEYIGNKGDNSSFLERLTATGKTFNVPVNINGNLTVTGSCTGCGGGGGSGTVNSGTASQLALYAANGAAVSGDSGLTDSGTMLSYAGSNGIAAAAGTFSGNVTVNGQLLVAGPWTVSSPVPGTAMPAAGAGTSALGISSDGNFYISANAGTPQKVATAATSSFFSNLFQEDGNDLGEYNGTTPQGLHVYGTYTNASNYERTGLSWDGADGYFVLKDENAGTGAQRGIGFWIGSSIRWGIDTTSTLKPFANNLINLGSTTLAPQTVYAATSFDTLTQGRHNFELCNDATTGTALNFLAVYNGASPACAVKAGTSNTDGVIGVVSNGSGTNGNAVITYRGYVPCSFDGSTVAGDFVVVSTTNAGDCHDAGATRPSGVQALGRVESTNTGVGTYGMRAGLDAPAGSGSGAVTSVFGRTGAVTAAAGDYTVAQVTGAAALASPTFTGTLTAPTAAANTNTTQVATTAFAHGVVPPDSSATVWMPVPHASSSGTVFSSSANKAAFFGVMLGFQKTTTQVGYWVSTADASATTYDLGIYSGTSGGTCTLVTHTGSVAGSTAMTSGAHTVGWAGGSVTLQAGRYYLALTASATASTAVIYGDSAGVTFAGGTGTSNVGNVSVTSGGTLPGSVTCPTDSVQVAALIPAWLVE